jgi:MFS family permease
VLLHDRNYMVLLVGRTLAMLAFAFAPVALAFGILALAEGTAVMLSAVLACQLGPHVVLTLFGGVIADRHSRALLIAAGECGVGLCWGGIGLLMLFGHTPMWALCLLAAGCGVFGSVVYPALTGIIPDLVPAGHLTEGNAWLQLGNATARLVGMVSGGAVVVLLDGGYALLTACGLYVVSAALMLTLPRESRSADRSESMVVQLRDGWTEFSSRQWLWVGVVSWGLMYFFFEGTVGVLGPELANLELGGAGAWTAVLAGEALGAMVGVAVSMFWRPRHPIFVGMSLSVLCGVPGILLGVSAPLWTVVTAAVLMGFGFELFTVYWLTTMQLEVPPQALSRVGAYDAFGSILLGPLGLVAAGPASEAFGVHLSLIVSGLLCVAIIALALLAPEVRKISPDYQVGTAL